jgi:hypothetical protein
MRISRQQECQPDAKPAQHGGAGRRLVEMHRLRVELGGEGQYLFARHQARAVDRDRAGLEVFPMEFSHGGILTRRGGAVSRSVIPGHARSA